MKLFTKTSCLVAEFHDHEQFLKVISDCLTHRIEILEVFSPYPIHGIESKLKHSKAGFWAGIGFIAGIFVTAALIFLTQYSFPLHLNHASQLIFYIPPAFVIALLFSGLFIWLHFRVSNQLLVGQKPHLISKRATIDKDCLVVEDSAENLSFFNQLQKEEIADIHRDVFIKQNISIPIPFKHQK